MTLKDEYKNILYSQRVNLDDLLSNWGALPKENQEELFLSLDRRIAEELFLRISPKDQSEILNLIPGIDRKSWIRLLPPDDVADLLQSLPADLAEENLNLLDQNTKIEVKALLAYKEDEAGGLMSSRFVRLRPEITVEEAIRYLHAQTKTQVETIYYAYVLDRNQKLLGAVSLRQLFMASSNQRIEEIMTKGDRLVTVSEDQDQEEIAHLFSRKEHLALPVIDREGKIKGIVTVDDVVHVFQEEATEDIQKFGGVEALDAPYFKVGFLRMIKKRTGWLLILFIGEMFTATAMGHYEDQIAKAVVLALFIPLIISSGGNSGSQASTLIIRAMALGEIRLKDWWRVFFREMASGLFLGGILGTVGLFRIFFWPTSESLYGEHYELVAITVGLSLIGIVLWGTLAGSMLPFLLRRMNLDPAAASAPFVATLVDVTGIVIYFSVAHFILGGILL